MQSYLNERETPLEIAGHWLFWIAVLGILVWCLTQTQHFVVHERLKLIFAFAIGSSTLYATMTVLRPCLKPGNNGLRRFGGWFVLLYVLILVSTVLFCLSYSVLAFFDPAARVYRLGAELDTVLQPLSATHTLFYGVLFLALDGVVYWGSASRQQEREFRYIFFHIDIPMCCGLWATLYLSPVVSPDPEKAELFVGGAAALQLFVANVHLLMYKTAALNRVGLR